MKRRGTHTDALKKHVEAGAMLSHRFRLYPSKTAERKLNRQMVLCRRGRGWFKTLNYNQSGFKLESGKLVLSKIGEIPIKLHRKIKEKVKGVIVKREGEVLRRTSLRDSIGSWNGPSERLWRWGLHPAFRRKPWSLGMFRR